MEAVWMSVAFLATCWAIVATVGWVCAALDRNAARADAEKNRERCDAMVAERTETADRAG